MCTALRELKEEGRLEGRLEGRIEGILDLLQDLGEVPEALENRIKAQENPAVLRLWHKASAKAQTIEAFVRMIE